MTEPSDSTEPRTDPLRARHRRVGWWSLLVFVAMGAVLEALHGFKVGWYLDVANETRRHMFTLAHAHGTLLGLVHLAFASTVAWPAAAPPPRSVAVASMALGVATVLLPGGFLLGGVVVHEGDPGLGIVLVPLGALALVVAVGCAAWSQRRSA